MSDVLREAERVLAEARAPRFRAGWLQRQPYSVRVIARRWRGMLGMVLGVGIALGIAMALLGTSNATIEIYTGDFRRSQADLYVVQQGGTLIPVLASDTPGTIEHGGARLGQIRVMPEVKAALGVMTWALERERDGPRRRSDPTELITTMGVDGDPGQIPGVLVLHEGRWLRRGDEVVLGPKLAREKALGLGSVLRLNGRDFTVVGIGKLRGFGFGLDAVAYLEHWAFRPRADLGDVFSIVGVDTADPALTRQRIQAIGRLSVFDTADLVRQAEKALETDNVAHTIIILMTMSIAGLFVSSMLSGAVAARRLEFATLRAIGIPARTILVAVLGEALVICLAAGLVGVAISSALGAWLNSYAPSFGLETLYVVDANLVGLIFGLALGLGLLAGFFPARDALRVEPVEVLREA